MKTVRRTRLLRDSNHRGRGLGGPSHRAQWRFICLSSDWFSLYGCWGMVTDNIDADLSATVAGSVDVNTLGTYTLKFFCNRFVRKQSCHSHAPTITVVDSSSAADHAIGRCRPDHCSGKHLYGDPFATAEDARDGCCGCCGDRGSSIPARRAPTPLTYTASDGRGNPGGSLSRTVNVAVVDDGPPSSLSLVVRCRVCRSIWGHSFTEPGVSATDAVDGEVT